MQTMKKKLMLSNQTLRTLKSADLDSVWGAEPGTPTPWITWTTLATLSKLTEMLPETSVDNTGTTYTIGTSA